MSAKTKRLGQVDVARQKGATGGTVPGYRSGAGARRGQRAGYRTRTRNRLLRWDMILLLLGAVVAGSLLGSAIIGEITTPKGTLAAAQTGYNFGDVPIGGGDIITKFPLTVQGNARAVDITST